MAEVSEKPVQDAPGQQKSVEIYLDGVLVTSPSRRLTGRQIRELGPRDRVDGFETQEVNAQGKRSARSATPRRRNFIRMSVSAPSPTTEVRVEPSDILLEAVKDLSAKSGCTFQISPTPVPGTQLFVVHTPQHEYRPEYTIPSGGLGFRVPFNFPDAAPEDSFFITAVDTKLKVPDSVRKSTDLNRVGRAESTRQRLHSRNRSSVGVFLAPVEHRPMESPEAHSL